MVLFSAAAPLNSSEMAPQSRRRRRRDSVPGAEAASLGLLRLCKKKKCTKQAAFTRGGSVVLTCEHE